MKFLKINFPQIIIFCWIQFNLINEMQSYDALIVIRLFFYYKPKNIIV